MGSEMCIRDSLFSQMQVDVPRHLKDLIQPRLRAMIANLPKLKATPTSSSSPSTNRHAGNSSRTNVYSLQDSEHHDSAPSNNNVNDDETGIMHSIGLIDPSIPGTRDDYDPSNTCLQCNVTEIWAPPKGVHSDIVHCCNEEKCCNTPDRTSTNNPLDAASHGTREQIDDGSNANTTNQRRLLWNYTELDKPKFLQDAGGRCHRALGRSYLMIPARSPTGVVAVLAYHTPTIEATIISPGGTCRQKHRKYHAHCVETNHDDSRSRMILRHRLRRSQDLIVDCLLQHGLSFTAAVLAPNIAQRQSPLPSIRLHANLISVDDLSSADPLLNPDDLFDVPHGMDVDDLATNFFVPKHDIEAAIHAVNNPPRSSQPHS